MFSNIFQGSGMSQQQKGKNFHISYNAYTDMGEETAIVYKNNFYILLGDYRDEYNSVIGGGITKVKAKYRELLKKGAKKSPWSK